MATLPRARVQDLVKLQCTLFSQTYNPHNLRTGNSVLRQRLRGPYLSEYYPPHPVTIKSWKEVFPQLETYDPKEVERIEGLTILRSKGKGAPKKKRTKEEGKKRRR